MSAFGKFRKNDRGKEDDTDKNQLVETANVEQIKSFPKIV